MTKLLFDGDMMEVLRKMNTAKQLARHLPGIDCAACGSPGCQSLAEDIVRGHATFGNCVFMQREMVRAGKISPERASEILDKVWGKDRIGLPEKSVEE
jgi:Na+-translocating ferredoxin:NAD+ oxidoreductase RNF subunit RnfB